MDEVKQTTKPTFFDLCMEHELGYSMLQVVADLAGVPLSTVEAMFAGFPVPKEQAQSVLVIVSQHTGKTCNLDTMTVPLLNESEIHHEHGCY